MTGTVLNIQRFSTHDGPGIRTTVFLKGCTCACAWCHNPESIRVQPEIQVYPDRCIGCGHCVECCPEGAHELAEDGKHYHRELCQSCGRCIDDCFADGIVWAGRSMEAEEVMSEIRADSPYYQRSGGGATFSGGEPVLQKAFLKELLQGCRAEGIHTAIQTAGNYRWEWLEELLPLIDLVAFDMKVWDPETHLRYVGAETKRIRENLRRVASIGVPLIVRTPLVGGVNDSDEEIGEIARYIGDFDSLLYYELLPYHGLGNAKRKSLGLEDDDPFYTPQNEQIAHLGAIARTYVDPVKP